VSPKAHPARDEERKESPAGFGLPRDTAIPALGFLSGPSIELTHRAHLWREGALTVVAGDIFFTTKDVIESGSLRTGNGNDF